MSKHWQIVMGLLLSLIGLLIGKYGYNMYVVSNESSVTFLIIGLLGIIYGYKIHKAWWPIPGKELVLGITTGIGCGVMASVSAFYFSHQLRFTLIFASTYFACLFFAFSLRHAQYHKL